MAKKKKNRKNNSRQKSTMDFNLKQSSTRPDVEDSSSSQEWRDESKRLTSMSPELSNALKVIPELIQKFPSLCDKFGLDYTITLLGMQSVGKSSLIGAILGVPLSWEAQGVGTRAPILYDVRRNLDIDCGDEKFIVKFECVQCSHEKIIHEIGAEMKRIEGEEKFSDELITITIEGDVPQIRLIDLIGLQTGTSDAGTIDKIVQKYIRAPNSKLAIVVNASSDPETMQDISRIDALMHEEIDPIQFPDIPGIRRGWRDDATLILNYANEVFARPNMQSAQSCNNWFSKYAQMGFPFYVVGLVPNDSMLRDVEAPRRMIQIAQGGFENMTIEDRTYWNGELPEVERRIFNHVFDKFGGVSEKYTHRCGVQKLIDELFSQIWRFQRSRLKHTRKMLEDDIEQAEKQKEKIDSMLEVQSPNKIRAIFGSDVDLILKDLENIYAGRGEILREYSAEQYGLNLKEEEEQFGSSDYDMEKVSSLIAQSRDDYIQLCPSLRCLGPAQIDRFVAVTKFAIISYEYEPLTYTRYFQAMAKFTGAISDTVEPLKIVREITTHQTNGLMMDIMEKFPQRFIEISLHVFNTVIQVKRSKLSGHDQFITNLRKEYCNWLKKLVSDAQDITLNVLKQKFQIVYTQQEQDTYDTAEILRIIDEVTQSPPEEEIASNVSLLQRLLEEFMQLVPPGDQLDQIFFERDPQGWGDEWYESVISKASAIYASTQAGLDEPIRRSFANLIPKITDACKWLQGNHKNAPITEMRVNKAREEARALLCQTVRLYPMPPHPSPKVSAKSEEMFQWVRNQISKREFLNKKQAIHVLDTFLVSKLRLAVESRISSHDVSAEKALRDFVRDLADDEIQEMTNLDYEAFKRDLETLELKIDELTRFRDLLNQGCADITKSIKGSEGFVIG